MISQPVPGNSLSKSNLPGFAYEASTAAASASDVGWTGVCTRAKKRSRFAFGTLGVTYENATSRTNGNSAEKKKRTASSCGLLEWLKSTPNQLTIQTSALNRPNPTFGELGSAGFVRATRSK